jgi:hypothetical protein
MIARRRLQGQRKEQDLHIIVKENVKWIKFWKYHILLYDYEHKKYHKEYVQA